MREHTRILVIRTDRIGDVVLATPLIRALRQTFPSAFIAALVQPYARDILLHNPHLNEILLDDANGEHNGSRGFWRQVKTLHDYHFDTALLLHPTARLAWMLLFAGIRTRIGVGSKIYEILTLMKTVSRQKYIPLRHEADYCLDLGRKIGVHRNDLSTEVFLTDFERREAKKALQVAGATYGREEVLVGIHPGSGRSAPNWRIERYVELAELLLQRRGTKIVLTGNRDEINFVPHFAGIASDRLVNLVGKLTLRQLMAVLSHCAVLVSASTGPMHLAAALKVPTVSLFCPVAACSPLLWGPQGNRAEIVLPIENYCGYKCTGDPHVCGFEGGIEVENVVERVLHLLEIGENRFETLEPHRTGL
jgi:heptosyltransferase-2